MKLPRTACEACALAVVVAHGVHYLTHTWQPADGVTYVQRGTIARPVDQPSRFDSEPPGRTVQYLAQTALTYTTTGAGAPSVASGWFFDPQAYRQGDGRRGA